MTTKWTIDSAHSEIEFKVKHLMISTVTGKFGVFSAEVESNEEDFSSASISFQAEIGSINTGNEMRDGHLKSDDFFNAELYPKLTFVSNSINKKSEGNFELVGDLTLRNISKSVTLKVEFNGLMTDPYGNQKAGFEITGTINRKDFDLKWTATTEAGGVVVSDEVKLNCNIQLTKVA